MGNIQANEKQSKTGKSPGKSKNFIRNLNRKSPGRDSKKHVKKKSDAKHDKIKDFDKTPDSDINEPIESSDNDTVECPSKTLGRDEDESWSVQSAVTVSKGLESSTEGPAPAPVAARSSPGPSACDSVFTDPLTPLAANVELNQCYYSAESDSTHDDFPRTLTPDPPALSLTCSVNMPHDDATSTLSADDMDREEKSDVFDDFSDRNDEVMGSKLSRSERKQRGTNECNHDFMDNRIKASPGQTSFTISKHRKVELPPVARDSSLTILENALLEKEKRHSSLSEVPPESNVLRKVASLTLDKLTESKVVRPCFVPEKLDFRLYEKFEGQMLLNWFVTSIVENIHLKNLLSLQDLKNLVLQFCTHLLAAGVLRQIADKDAPTEIIFKPNLMYYWSHMEVPASQPVTPGRLLRSPWPHDNQTFDFISKQLGYDNKFSIEEINDINEAKLIIKQLIRKLQELESQIDRHKNSTLKAITKNIEKSYDCFTVNNNLNKVRVELVSKEVQTVDIEFSTLSKPVINIPENDPQVRTNVNTERLLDISNLNSKNELENKNIKTQSEYRSEHIENFCKLNKSRDSHENFQNEEEASCHSEKKIIEKNDGGIPKFQQNKHNDAITAIDSSSDASFVSAAKCPSDTDSSKEMFNDVPLRKKSNSTSIPEDYSVDETDHIIVKTEPLESLLDKGHEAINLSSLTTCTSTSKVEVGSISKQVKSSSPPPPLPGMPPSPPPMPGTNNTSVLQNSVLSKTEISLEIAPKSPVFEAPSPSPMSGVGLPPPPMIQIGSPLPLPMIEMKPPLPPMSEKLSQSPPVPGTGPPPPPMPGMEPLPMPGMGPAPPPMPGMGPPPPPMPGMGPPPPPMPGMGPPPPPMPGMGPPPPPMPGMGPPPPPMPGMGPPPPPMPGMGPPPPPMPGMGPPPPPMPGMGPPPPPMPGMGPPPPPMPGMGPPPPPMPGMGPPPPPMPGMGPPPPPMPGMGPPPPPMAGMGPPPPPMPGMGPPPPPISGMGAPPIPGMGSFFTGQCPPPPPPPSGPNSQLGPLQSHASGPIPFPAPPVGGWVSNRAVLRKSPVNPVSPMKPLYWTRILAQTPATCQGDSLSKPLWLEIDEAKIDNIDEFTDLFCRQVVKAPVKKKVEVKTKIQPMKILDSKRSQNVGILAQSLHVEFSEIENAIYNFDTSVVSLEALHQIYELRASEEELRKIKEHLNSKSDIPLDRPEAFLNDLSGIPNFAERISCFMFQSEFEDAASTTMHKLDNLKHTCEFLTSSESLKQLFAIILTLGNYMNGGNGQRGQADGFGLEILSKLKDVKSKQSNVTLLHFIVRTYVRGAGGALAAALPVPEPGDVARAAAVDYADVAAQLAALRKQLDACKEKTKKVLETNVANGNIDNNSPDEGNKRLEVFRDKMTTFLNAAEDKLKTETENLEECRNKFIATVKFYQYSPKCGKVEDCEPKEFFALWTSFCSDFKDIFKKEEQLAIKEKLKEAKKLLEERKSSTRTQPKKEGGLKSRLQKLANSRK